MYKNVQMFIVLLFALILPVYQASAIQAISSNEAYKLIYVGTNETFSEALYHLDLQDGKLNEPHIVVSLRKGNIPKVLKFINKHNKVIKQFEFARNFDIDIINDKYAMVREKLVRPGEEYVNSYNTYYYDASGELLWKKLKNYYAYFVSSDGERILQVFNYGAIQFSNTIEVSTLNKNGVVLNKSSFPTKVGGEYIMMLSHQFDLNNDYLLDFTVDNQNGPIGRIYYLYDNAGTYISSYESSYGPVGLPIKLFSDFNAVMITRVNLDRHSNNIVILNRFGKEIASDEILSVDFVPNDNIISKIASSGDIFSAKYEWPNEWQYFNRLEINGGSVEEHKLIDQNNILIELRQRINNLAPTREASQSIFYLITPNNSQILSQRTIDYARDSFKSKVISGDIYILYCSHVATDDWADEVTYEEPRYDIIQVFRKSTYNDKRY